MSDNQSNNKRIAKNTLLLYFRMLLLLFVGLFTSRVILQALGVEDYGINSVIAGFLSMFGIITGSLSSAISRFITVELGKENFVRLKQVFSTSITVQLIMGGIIVLLIETFGMWFLENKMQIPEGREVAAQWCLHCATLTSFIGLMNVPFNSAIVAHEKMSAFAYMSIVDALLKLSICYLIYVSPIDKLITYAILGVCVSIITTSFYWLYCLRIFEETSFSFKFEKELFRDIWGFAGWNFFGNSAYILNTQGVNMLMNIFFNVTVNAARGIAVQLNGVIQQFVNNFMMALNPQITKSYSSGDKQQAFVLACRGARFSFYIMFLLALPLMVEANQVLKLWLGNPPQHADIYMIWTIIGTLTLLVGNTLVTLQMAHGNIRHYQIWITIYGCLPFPLTWIAFKLGAPAVSGFVIYALVYWCLIFVRYYLVRGMTQIPAKMYLVGVVVRCHIVAIIASVIPIIVIWLLPPSYMRLVISIGLSIMSTTTTIYTLGLETSEKKMIKTNLQKIMLKINRKHGE